jgi:hypothetical protein
MLNALMLFFLLNGDAVSVDLQDELHVLKLAAGPERLSDFGRFEQRGSLFHIYCRSRKSCIVSKILHFTLHDTRLKTSQSIVKIVLHYVNSLTSPQPAFVRYAVPLQCHRSRARV